MEEVIAEYKKAYPHVELSIYQQEMLAFEITDLDAWKQTIRFWAGNSYRGQSVFKMIEYYKQVINERIKNRTASNVGRWDGTIKDSFPPCEYCGDEMCLTVHT